VVEPSCKKKTGKTIYRKGITARTPPNPTPNSSPHAPRTSPPDLHRGDKFAAFSHRYFAKLPRLKNRWTNEAIKCDQSGS
jgi:hypothetical protein